MEYSQFLILQLIAHLLYDFFFQNDLWVRHRQRYKFRSKILYWHTLIVFLLSWIFSFQWSYFVCSIIIALSHFILDGLKPKISKIRLGRKLLFSRAFFFVDQFIHICIIIICANAFETIRGFWPVFEVQTESKTLLLILAYLICLKPSNVFIKQVFLLNNFKVFSNPNEDLLNAGKLIGNIERVLTLTLLLFEQFEAVGFIIAGKSILRYEGVKTSKTEYVLIGTFLSFGIAIMISILYTRISV